MIEIDVRHFAGIETLHAFPAGKGEQPLPCIVFYHGFTSSKLVYSYFAVALAQAGFRVVMQENEVEVRAVGEFLAAELAVGDDGKFGRLFGLRVAGF